MMGNDLYIYGGGSLDVPGIGRVSVTVRRNARAMKLRWKGTTLSLTVPYGQSYNQAISFVQGASGFIEANRPTSLYSIGQRIEGAEFDIEIKRGDIEPGLVRVLFPAPLQATVIVAPDLDIAATHVEKTVDGMIRRIAARFAPGILLPLAAEISERLGVKPASWKVSRGQRTLGLCSASRHISLSSLLIFYPEELRRYVICHELAHLTHMDHSPAFHALCQSYCGIPSPQARAAIRAVTLPLIK